MWYKSEGLYTLLNLKQIGLSVDHMKRVAAKTIRTSSEKHQQRVRSVSKLGLSHVSETN